MEATSTFAKTMEQDMIIPAFQIFDELRLAGELGDVVLVAGGAKFKAHRVILCGCSPYFRALFTSDWNDSRTHEYQLPGISPEAMKLIIEYAYTYSVLVTVKNVESLLAAADQLNILRIVQRCSDFLRDQLCLENCIDIFKMADIYCLDELHQSAFHCILKHFKEVASTSEQFLDLTLHQLCDVIEKDELDVKREEVVFDAILRWIMHEPASRKAHISVLLPKVRMARLDPEYFLRTVKDNEVVKANAACRPIVRDVLKATYDLDLNSPRSDFENPLTRPRLPSEILLAIGGFDILTTSWIDAYDSRADRWVDIMQREECFLALQGTVCLNGFVYCMGAFNGREATDTLHRFDPITQTWQKRAPMCSDRCLVCVVVLDGLIYTIGGFDGFEMLETAERYDPNTDKWTAIQSTNERRSNTGATTLDGKIYICGGYNGSEYLSSGESYDPLTDHWTPIASMRTARSGAGVAAYNGRIYVVAGSCGTYLLRSVEAYDPVTNRWHDVAPLFTPRHSFGIQVLDDLLFVLGGRSGSKDINKVECYDAETGKWYHAQDMSTAKSGFSCCLVPALPSIIQYAAPR